MNTVVVRDYLRLFRAQTFPATLLMVFVPFLANMTLDLNMLLKSILLSTLLLLTHFFSFGHNSLMDFAMMYDQRDPNKKHHPLISGAIELARAHNVIHWGLSSVTIVMAMLTVFWSPNIGYAMICLMGWVGFGHAYNDGLSKESIFGFLAMSFSMMMMGGWGWFLSHENMNLVGWVFVAYVFCTILYQVSWSGFVKEMQIRESSNILTRMGARLDATWKGEREFIPGKARFYAYFTKATGLFLGGLLSWLNYNVVRLVIWVLLTIITVYLLHHATKPRVYDRKKELISMSFMEITTIYLPIPLILDLNIALVLMVFGIIYFWLINRIIWGSALYPKV